MLSSLGRMHRLEDDDGQDYTMLQDLQLAAELGKTLLERNKELENCIKANQATMEDQAQEIEYLKKQIAAMREANDSRLRIYEHLEVSVQDLERANERLVHERTNDKKTIKSQTTNIDNLETKIDDLQNKYDQLNSRHEALLRQQARNSGQFDPQDFLAPNGSPATSEQKSSGRDDGNRRVSLSPRRTGSDDDLKSENIAKILEQLQDAKNQRSREQKRVAELKEKLDAILQENAQLEEQVNEWKSKAACVKTLQQEVVALQEVRQGQLCGRCLRGIESRGHDELSSILDHEEEEDEVSLAETLAAEGILNPDSSLQGLATKSVHTASETDNPYQILVEKYETIKELRKQMLHRSKLSTPKPSPAAHAHRATHHQPSLLQTPTQEQSSLLSLQEELQMSGEFNSNLEPINSQPSNQQHPGNQQSADQKVATRRKPCTPTDFSETETLSSGFSDETSNKFTQTDSQRPGSFLCSIADGDDCKFSIYDDFSNFRSRFQKTPEYRQLFSEIFEILKRAAVAKAEGEALPLLDEKPCSSPSTPKAEDQMSVSELAPSEFTADETASVISLAVSSVMSEPVFRVNTPVMAGRSGEAKPTEIEGLKPLQHNTRRQPLEYLSIQVRRKAANNQQRRSRSKRKNRDQQQPGDSPTPDVVPSCNPKIGVMQNSGGGGGRKKYRHISRAELMTDGTVWNGGTAHFYSNARQRRRGQHQQHHQESPGLEEGTADGFSKASEEVAKLRRLEMSYAEALKMPSGKSGKSRHRKRQPQQNQQQQ